MRVMELKVGQSGLIEEMRINGKNVWVKATLVDDQGGEYIMRTESGNRISCDGYEIVK